MTRRRITDTEAQQLLAGQALEGQPEFDALAHAVGDFRTVAYARTPQPSAALRDRLDTPQTVGVSAEAPPSRGIKNMLGTITGLGLAAKLAIGTGALAIGVAGVGAAGALPGPLQESFDSVVVTDEEIVEEELLEEDAPEGGLEEEPADELPVGSDEFGSWVSEMAQDPDKVGAEFGKLVSEQARELRDENRDAREGADEEEPSEDESVAPSSERGGPGSGNGNGNGKGGRP